MAFLKLNQKTLDMIIEVGALENYQPNESIKELQEIAHDLKKITTIQMKVLFDNKPVEEVRKLLGENNELSSSWNIFLDNEYKPKLSDLLEKIKEVNKQICPGYKEFVEVADKKRE